MERKVMGMVRFPQVILGSNKKKQNIFSVTIQN